MAVRGILKKDGVARRKKRNLEFSKTINHIKEFDEELPVKTITNPSYKAPYNPKDNDDDIIYWWEMDDEIVDWDDENNEWDIEGYTWDDVIEESNLEFRSDAFEDAYFEDPDEESSDDSSSSSSDSSYDEETVSDDDSDYQIDDQPQEPVQLDVEALKAEQKRMEPPRLVPEREMPDSSTRSMPERASDTAPSRSMMQDSSDENLDASRGSTGGPRRARPRRTSRSAQLVQAAKAVAKELAPALDFDPETPAPAPAPVPASNPERLSLTLRDTPETLLSPPAATPSAAPVSAAAAAAASILSSVEKVPAIKEEPKKKVKRHTSKGSKGSGSSHKKRDSLLKNPSANGIKKKKHKKRESDPNITTTKVKHLKKHPRPQPGTKDYSWEKPDWSKENKLKQTKRGRLVRKGANLAKPITMINRAMNDMMDAKLLAFGRPEWAKKAEILKQTELGNSVKSGGSLARKITHIASDPEYRNALGWSKPEWTEKKMVKETEKGRAVKKGECISRAITHIRDDEEVTSKYAWEKPEWAKKSMVRSTKEGEKVKKGEYLSGGITNNQDAKDKYGWEKPDWTNTQLKRSSTASSQPSSTKSMGVDFNEDAKAADDSAVQNGRRSSNFNRYKRTSSLPNKNNK